MSADSLLEAISKIKQKAMQLEKSELNVGFFPDADYSTGVPVAQVAYVNEFGAQKGVPARPFFRQTIDAKKTEWIQTYQDQAKLFLDDTLELGAMLDRMGGKISADVKNTIVAGNFQPLSPVTLAIRRWKRENSTQVVSRQIFAAIAQAVAQGKTGKGQMGEPDGNTDILRDTGLMLASITWEHNA